jgi:hypothetical protein
MIYWKQVDIGDYKTYTPKICKYFDENILTKMQARGFVGNTFWNPIPSTHVEQFFPELISSVSLFGEIKEVSIIHLNTPLGSGSTLHIDHTHGLNNGVKARLNIPLKNTEGSETCFYDVPEEHEYKVSLGGTIFWAPDLHLKLKPVTSVEVTKPTILRISQPHMVRCWSNKMPRLTLTISFKDDIVRLLDE